MEKIKLSKKNVAFVYEKQMSSRNKLIKLVGVSGVGKTYLLCLLGVSELSGEVRMIDFGCLLRETARSRGEVLSSENARIYEQEVLDTIFTSRIPTIITAHLLHFNGADYHFDAEMEEYARPSGYIFVGAEPQTIFERRKQDAQKKLKNRALEDVATIAYHQEKTLQLAADLAACSGAHFIRVQNEGPAEKNLAVLTEHVYEVFKNDLQIKHPLSLGL